MNAIRFAFIDDYSMAVGGEQSRRRRVEHQYWSNARTGISG